MDGLEDVKMQESNDDAVVCLNEVIKLQHSEGKKKSQHACEYLSIVPCSLRACMNQ
jgi:hypothetical protein